MAAEIERKFLVKGDAWRAHVKKSHNLRQGYLRGLGEKYKAEVRVRIADECAFLTIKDKGGLVRKEFEYEIPTEDAETILRELCEPYVISKTRHEVEHGGVVWCIDEFAGKHADLVLAEVELTDAGQHVDLPEWIGRELTDDPTYRNASLAAAQSVPRSR